MKWRSTQNETKRKLKTNYQQVQVFAKTKISERASYYSPVDPFV